MPRTVSPWFGRKPRPAGARKLSPGFSQGLAIFLGPALKGPQKEYVDRPVLEAQLAGSRYCIATQLCQRFSGPFRANAFFIGNPG